MKTPRRISDLDADQLRTLSSPGSSRSATAEGESRQLIPGTRFGKRYRIVELLGEGGMGEVYRADDLQLGQTVALKFLPRHLTDDPTALARLRNEVRVARHVSHTNVCRVFDIGEEDGQFFISMEYVDGEDLASVLRRLGRPSREKSLQIARQLCAGLAAAHESGILHRDLKPANVMIDGLGRVRITDFGMAAFAADLGAEDALAGTPAYMAPEQLAGHGVSARSDIFGLGLVLYELFTGTAAYTARSFDDPESRRAGAPPPSPYRYVDEIDPAVERAIMECLDPDPRRRPASALEVAATLPGGDPIQEALAAGETPSPETVAAAGGQGALRPAVAIGLAAAILAGLAVLVTINDRSPQVRLPLPETPPVVLADRARGILDGIGLTAPPADRAFGFWSNSSYIDHVRSTEIELDRWSELSSKRPTVHQFWYRESPTPMVPWNPLSNVGFKDPPPRISGMSRILLDEEGRLQFLEVVPPQIDPARGSDSVPDFESLFAAAGLNPGDFSDAAPEWNPTRYVEARRAWTGHYPDQPVPPLRIEAAAYGGRPVYFHIVHPFSGPWLEPHEHSQSVADRAVEILFMTVAVLAIFGAPWIARRNLRQGSGDRRGAIRLGSVVLASSLLTGLFTTSPQSILVGQLDHVLPAVAIALFIAVWVGCAYVALEPYARRLWPQTLITWSRVLLGRFRDPRVGRDILVGGSAGLLAILLQRIELLVPAWFAQPTAEPHGAELYSGLHGVGHLFSPNVLIWPTFVLLLLTGLLYLLRKPWIAAAAALAILVLMDGHWQEGAAGVGTAALVAAIAETLVVWIVLLFVTIRFGLFACMVMFFFAFRLQTFPITFDWTAWYAGNSLLLLGVLAALVIYAARISVGGAIPRRPQADSG